MQISGEENSPFSQVQFSSTSQLSVHPSLFSIFPSSHSSMSNLSPSPHKTTHISLLIFGMNPCEQSSQVSAVVTSPPVHTHPLSITQFVQQSEFIALLSSHSSSPALNPSPQ